MVRRVTAALHGARRPSAERAGLRSNLFKGYAVGFGLFRLYITLKTFITLITLCTGNFQDPDAMTHYRKERHSFGSFYYRYPNGESGKQGLSGLFGAIGVISK